MLAGVGDGGVGVGVGVGDGGVGVGPGPSHEHRVAGQLGGDELQLLLHHSSVESGLTA